MSCFVHETRFGKVGASFEGAFLTKVYLLLPENPPAEERRPVSAAEKFFSELDEYFSGCRKTFTIPYIFHGTPFQERIWNALLEIPYGKTVSYEEIAERAGNRKACRAAGMALNRNPLPIVIPCHRIIGKDSSLTGFGSGLDWKKKLLMLENSEFSAIV